MVSATNKEIIKLARLHAKKKRGDEERVEVLLTNGKKKVRSA